MQKVLNATEYVVFEFCSEKGCSKCVNLLIMRFDGSVSENLWGDFLPEMVDSTAISGQIFLILMLDQFSQRRRCALNWCI